MKYVILFFWVLLAFVPASSQRYRFNLALVDTPAVTHKDIYAQLHAEDTVFVQSDLDRKGYFFHAHKYLSKQFFGDVWLPGLYRISVTDTTLPKEGGGASEASGITKKRVYQFFIYPAPVDTSIMKRSLLPIVAASDKRSFHAMSDTLRRNQDTINRGLDSLMLVLNDSSSRYSCIKDSIQKDSLNLIFFLQPEEANLLIAVENEGEKCDSTAITTIAFQWLRRLFDLPGTTDSLSRIRFQQLLSHMEANRQYRTLCVRDIYKNLVGPLFDLSDETLCNHAGLFYRHDYFEQLIFMVKLKKTK